MFKTRGIEKLKKVLINDKHFQPSRLNDMVRSEIFKCLSNYMEISAEDIKTSITVEEDGQYVLRCKVRCPRLKIMGILPNEV